MVYCGRWSDMVFKCLPPNPLPGIKRVETLKIMGVTLSQLLSFEPHIDKIVAQAAQSMYALRVLRAQGPACARVPCVCESLTNASCTLGRAQGFWRFT